MNRADEPRPHRLFAAIVLMGSGLAVGCGGIAEGKRQASSGGGSNASGSGAGTAPTANAGSGGGAGSGGVGGANSASGSANIVEISVGGSGPEPVDPGPFACPPEQWSCPSLLCSGSGYLLPENGCACDPERPLVPSDCGPGEVFVCQTATWTWDDRPLTKPVALACVCLPKTDCSSECAAAYGRPRLRCQDSPDELSASCGCAFPLLK